MKTVTVAALILIVAIPLILRSRALIVAPVRTQSRRRRRDDRLYDIDDFLT
jgi:hypothetical protein